MFLLAIFAGAALAAKKSKVPVLVPKDGSLRTNAGVAPSAVMYEGKGADCEQINPEVPVNPATPVAVGYTYYDEQQIGSMGRMIAVGPGGHRHFILQETRGPFGLTYPRYITYNCTDGGKYWVGPTWIDGGDDINAGYPQMSTMHDGREIVLYHRQDTPIWYSSLLVGDEGDICTGYFTNKYDLPDVHDFPTSTVNGYWAKGAIGYDADTDYIHIVTTEGDVYPPGQNPDRTIAYQRCNFQGNNLVCYSPGYGP